MIEKKALYAESGLFILFLAISFLLYYNSLHAPFIFDDYTTFADNYDIKDPARLNAFANTRYIGYLTFALNYAIDGLNQSGYHVLNIIIHWINGCLVYLLIKNLLRVYEPEIKSSKYMILSGIGASLFLAHPVQTQAVTYLSQRFASLCTLFYFAAALAYIKFRINRKKSYAIVALLCTILAMKTKEIAFTIPFIMLIIDYLFFSFSLKKRTDIIRLIPFFLTLFIIPLTLAHGGKPATEILQDASEISKETGSISRYSYLLTEMRVIITYLRIFFVPINLRLDYTYQVFHTFWNKEVLYSFLLILLTISSAFLIRKKNKLFTFGILWFFVTLSVESSIIPIKDVIYEHRMYLPLFGIIFSIAALLMYVNVRVSVPIFIAIIIIFSVLTIERNAFWTNKIAFFEDNARKAPLSHRAQLNVAIAHLEAKQYEKALNEAARAEELDPSCLNTHMVLADIYYASGKTSEALKEMHYVTDKGEVEHFEQLDLAYNKMAGIYWNLGNTQSSFYYVQKSLALNPYRSYSHFNAALYYFYVQHNVEAAENHLRTAIQTNPNNYQAHTLLAYVNIAQKNYTNAIHEAESALSINNKFKDAYLALYDAYTASGRFEEARKAYQQAQ